MKVRTFVKSKEIFCWNVNGSRLVAHKMAAIGLDDYFSRVTSCACTGHHFLIFYYLISGLLRPPGPWKKREESYIFLVSLSFFEGFYLTPIYCPVLAHLERA